ncbi:hypothetical protein LIA77_04375 [Sarocladium implicatum]|nr:hypothetical protein LIA77_04375 [Sarocladium implicatum]
MTRCHLNSNKSVRSQEHPRWINSDKSMMTLGPAPMASAGIGCMRTSRGNNSSKHSTSKDALLAVMQLPHHRVSHSCSARATRLALFLFVNDQSPSVAACVAATRLELRPGAHDAAGHSQSEMCCNRSAAFLRSVSSHMAVTNR